MRNVWWTLVFPGIMLFFSSPFPVYLDKIWTIYEIRPASSINKTIWHGCETTLDGATAAELIMVPLNQVDKRSACEPSWSPDLTSHTKHFATITHGWASEEMHLFFAAFLCNFRNFVTQTLHSFFPADKDFFLSLWVVHLQLNLIWSTLWNQGVSTWSRTFTRHVCSDKSCSVAQRCRPRLWHQTSLYLLLNIYLYNILVFFLSGYTTNHCASKKVMWNIMIHDTNIYRLVIHWRCLEDKEVSRSEVAASRWCVPPHLAKFPYK